MGYKSLDNTPLYTHTPYLPPHTTNHRYREQITHLASCPPAKLPAEDEPTTFICSIVEKWYMPGWNNSYLLQQISVDKRRQHMIYTGWVTV